MKNLLFILATILLLASCKTSSLNNKTKHLEIGMTKKELISVMGKDFKIVSASKTPAGNSETILYNNTPSDGRGYVMYLLNGKLDRWHEMNKDSYQPHSNRKKLY